MPDVFPGIFYNIKGKIAREIPAVYPVLFLPILPPPIYQTVPFQPYPYGIITYDKLFGQGMYGYIHDKAQIIDLIGILDNLWMVEYTLKIASASLLNSSASIAFGTKSIRPVPLLAILLYL